jgi:hypothetical protein
LARLQPASAIANARGTHDFTVASLSL